MPEQQTPSATEDDVETPEQEATTEQPTEPTLGDEGKKAIKAERDARRAAERALKDVRAELDTLKQSQMSDQEKAILAAKAEARTEALAEANRRVVAAEVKAAAVGKVVNPTLAVKLVDTTAITVADDGSVDQAAVNDALDQLLTDYPELVPTPTRASGSADGGPKKTTTPSIAQQIAEAEAKRDFDTAGRLKAQQLMERPKARS